MYEFFRVVGYCNNSKLQTLTGKWKTTIKGIERISSIAKMKQVFCIFTSELAGVIAILKLSLPSIKQRDINAFWSVLQVCSGQVTVNMKNKV